MLKAVGQNLVLLGGLVIGAAVSGLTAPMLMSSRGALGPTLFGAVSLAGGVMAVAISLAVSTAVAVVVGRMSNTVIGLFTLGGGLFGLAWRMETIQEVAYVGSLPGLAVETLLWAVLVLGATAVVFRLSGPLPDVEPEASGRPPNPFLSSAALKSAAAGIIVIPVVWIIAQSPAKGQAIGAVFCGAMLAGLAGRLLSPHVQPILIFAAALVFGAVGHVVGAIMLGTGVDLADALVNSEVKTINFPMPVDYAAGSLMGVAVGLGWAKSFLQHDEEEEEAGVRSVAPGPR